MWSLCASRKFTQPPPPICLTEKWTHNGFSHSSVTVLVTILNLTRSYFITLKSYDSPLLIGRKSHSISLNHILSLSSLFALLRRGSSDRGARNSPFFWLRRFSFLRSSSSVKVGCEFCLVSFGLTLPQLAKVA